MAAPSSVIITYVPADCGSIIPGKSKAPAAFQSVNITEKLLKARITIVAENHAFHEPVTYVATPLPPGGVRNEELNVKVCLSVRASLAQTLDESQARPKRVGLIYIDADTDLASPTDPDSTGIFAGMNMTHLTCSPRALKSMDQFCRASGQPLCDASNTVFFGLNMSLPSNKREHFAFLFDNNYKVVSSASVAQEPEKRAREALRYLEDRVDFIVVHLDVDSIDPQMFPLANVPNFTGVKFEQMMRALRVFVGSKKIAGLSIAEVNPDHDPKLEMVERLTNEVVAMLRTRASLAD